MSYRQAEKYLLNRGIDCEIISEVLSDYKNNERAVLDKLVEKKYKNKLDKKNYNKVFASLTRKGFSPKDILDTLDMICEENVEGYDYQK